MNSRFSCHICSVGEMGDNQCRNCATSTEGLQPGKPEEEGDILTKGIQGTAGKGRGRQECGKVDLAVLQLKSPDVMSCEEIKHCLRREGLQVSGKKEVLMNRLIRHRAGEITAEGRLKSKKVVAERVRPQVDGSSVIPKTINMKKLIWYKKKKSYMDEYSVNTIDAHMNAFDMCTGNTEKAREMILSILSHITGDLKPRTI